MKLVQRIRSKLSNTASSSRRQRCKQQDGGRSCRRKFPDPNVYFGISQVTTSMFRQDNWQYSRTLVQIVRTTLAFWCENSTICQRHIWPVVAAVGRPRPTVTSKQIRVLNGFDYVLFGSYLYGYVCHTGIENVSAQ